MNEWMNEASKQASNHVERGGGGGGGGGAFR
jgi:hypothetical protein